MSGAGVSDAVVEACSGALGSVLALLATYPLKTIYTLQALSTGVEKATPEARNAVTRLLTTVRFLRTYKLSSLYDGLGPNIVESALSSGVYFFFYSTLRDYAVAWTRRRQQAAATANSGSGAAVVTAGAGRGATIGVLASLLVATAAGACNQLITMPASVVATRMQGYRSLPGAKDRPPPSTWGTISSVLREEGPAGFWKGLLPSMILLANPAVQYMLYEKLITLLRYWKGQRLARQRASATAAAVAAAAAVGVAVAAAAATGSPLHDLQAEAKKAAAADRAHHHRGQSADSDEALGIELQAHAAKQAGATAAPRSATSASASPLVSRRASLNGRDSCSSAAAARPPPLTLSAGEVFLAGALAKIGATVVTYPLIVVKARLQASGGGKAGGAGDAGAYRASTWGVISDTARHEGLGGFFKGLRAKILQTALNAALMLMLKEQLHGATRSALAWAAEQAVGKPAAA